jgi:putative phage-type endonuclease
MSVVEQKESWATAHKGGLGGTDSAAVLNLNPWRKPIDVWADKVHPENRIEIDKDCLRWGCLLEPVIRQEYARKFDIDVTNPADMQSIFPNSRKWEDSTIITGKYPWMVGMPDGYIKSTRTGLEIKTAARRSDEWGKPGTDEIPAHYFMQCAWYMAVTDSPSWNVSVLFSGSDLQQYHIVRDLDLERDAVEACRDFWESYVVKGIEPPVDESESYGRYLARKFSLSTGAVIKTPSPELIEWAVKMKQADDDEKSAADRKREANNHLRVLVGDAQKAITPIGSVGWIRPVQKDVTDYAAVVEELAPLYDRVRAAQSVSASEVIASHTEPKQNEPYLRAWWKR